MVHVIFISLVLPFSLDLEEFSRLKAKNFPETKSKEFSISYELQRVLTIIFKYYSVHLIKCKSPTETMRTINLCSKENEIFEVDIDVAKMSLTIKTMLEDLGHEDDKEVIRVPKISSDIMRLVIAWSVHHVNEVPSDQSDDEDYDDDYESRARRSDNIDPWDKELLKPLDSYTLFELIMACNYLNIRGLLTSSSKTVANMIKGKTPEQIRQVFNIQMPVAVNNHVQAEGIHRG